MEKTGVFSGAEMIRIGIKKEWITIRQQITITFVIKQLNLPAWRKRLTQVKQMLSPNYA